MTIFRRRPSGYGGQASFSLALNSYEKMILFSPWSGNKL